MSDLFLRPLFTWRAVVASKFGPENPTTRHVLLTLGLWMSEKGDSCFPATRTLAEATGLSHRSVLTHLELAAAGGWIGRKERSLKEGKGWRRMEYFARIPRASETSYRGEVGSPASAGEVGSPAQVSYPQGGERPSIGGEPDDTLVVKDVHLSTSVNSTRTKEGGTAAPPGDPRKQRKGKTLMPADFGISDQVRAWSKLHGFEPYLEAHFAYLKDYAASNGVLKADWDATFRNSIRADWGGVRKAILVASGASKAAPAQRPWWQTASGIEEKGREVGVQHIENEPFPYFKARVFKAVGPGPWA